MKKDGSDLDVHKLDKILRDFLVLREGKISHLTIPAFPKNYDDVTELLKKDIPYLEVCGPTSCKLLPRSSCCMQIHQDQT